jgi:lipid-A-disaccharide synthase
VTEVLAHIGDILAARKALLKRIREYRPALLILIDYPDFNLLLAAKAKKMGIPIFYYISPQVWAWRSGRVKKIGRLADRIAVILPFEKEFYRQRGVAVDFVGHPLMDSVHVSCNRQQFHERHRIEPGKKIVGLLPGSRAKEITALLPDFVKAAEQLSRRDPQRFVFLLPRASTISRQLLEENGVREFRDHIDIRIIEDNRYDLMAACDAAVAASGTVTLELAILGIPLLTTYRVSARTYRLGRLLVKLDFFSLVNLVAGREIIKELLQDEVTPENISNQLGRLLNDPDERAKTLGGLREVKELLGDPGASQRAAAIALELKSSKGLYHE